MKKIISFILSTALAAKAHEDVVVGLELLSIEHGSVSALDGDAIVKDDGTAGDNRVVVDNNKTEEEGEDVEKKIQEIIDKYNSTEGRPVIDCCEKCRLANDTSCCEGNKESLNANEHYDENTSEYDSHVLITRN